MKDLIQDRLSQIGDDSNIIALNQVSGGDINQAYEVKTERHHYFIKANKDVPPHFFKVEATGLSLIKATNTVCVPHVHYYDQPQAGEAAVMIMDWIEGTDSIAASSDLGRNLARMHQHTNNKHGLETDTFIGTIAQTNSLHSDWVSYYQQQRLGQQLTIAIDRGRVTTKRREKLEKLINNLDTWINHQPNASLLHGDLWGGNWIGGPNGTAYLIDPSILYGDHAFEIAFTELFGGFPPAFYHAYQEVTPLPANYEEIKPLYQLYYLLVHLNMFGESYAHSVDRILNRYV